MSIEVQSQGALSGLYNGNVYPNQLDTSRGTYVTCIIISVK